MTKTPRRERKNYWWLYLLIISLPFLVLITFASYRLYCVMGLQNTIVGVSHIGFGNFENLNADGWEYEVINYLEKKATERGIEFSSSSKERCRAILLSRIDVIGITERESFTPEFDAALGRFPHLRFLEFSDLQGTLREKDVATLFTALRRMKRLEEVGLFSLAVTDSSFALLAGHPSLSKVNFGLSSITPEVADTLKTLPNLKEVNLFKSLQRDDIWAEASTQLAFRDSLPGVKVEIVERWK